MSSKDNTTLPDSVETLRDWKLSNSDEPFNPDEFLSDFASYADQANQLFNEAFADFHCE